MNSISRHIKMATLGLMGAIVFTAPVYAQANPTYNTPVFNSFANAEGYGAESDFLRIAEPGTTNYDNELTNCSDGAVATVSMYIHNNAAEAYNAPNNTGSGVATGVKASITAPYGSMASHFTVNGKITAANASTVNDTATINCGNTQYTLNYVPGSGRIYTAVMNGTTLPDALFTDAGTTIGYDQLNGVVPGCWEFRATVQGQVKLTKQPTTPPKEIPNTGAGSIFGLLSVTAVAGAFVHRLWTIRKSN